MFARIRPEVKCKDIFNSLWASKNELSQFEESLKAYFQVSGVHLVPAARVALYYILKALPQTKVYISAYTCWVIPEAALLAGKELHYVDINPKTYNLNLELLQKELQNDSIVIATHQFGFLEDMDTLCKIAKEKNSIVIEDCAAAIGAEYHDRKVGNLGAASIISFEFTKTLTAGRGGAALFQDKELEARYLQLYKEDLSLRNISDSLKLRFNLAVNLLLTVKLWFKIVHSVFTRLKGETTASPDIQTEELPDLYLSTFDPARAKLGNRNFKRLEPIIQRRREIENLYRKLLKDQKGIELPQRLDHCKTSLIRFPLRLLEKNKLDFYRCSVKQGLDLAFTFPYTCETDPIACLEARKAADQVINLPIYTQLSDQDIHTITEKVKYCLQQT